MEAGHLGQDSGTFMFFMSPTLLNLKAGVPLQISILLHGLSASIHLVFLLFLSFFCIWKRCRSNGYQSDSKERSKGRSFSFYKAALLACLCLSLFYLSLCFVNYFQDKHSWSGEKVYTLSDLAVRTIAWIAVSAYLFFDFSQSSERKFPVFLRMWWYCYFLLSCARLVIGLVLMKKEGTFVPQLVLDAVSVVMGVILSYAGFYGKEEGEEDVETLEEPLLNGNHVNDESAKSSGKNCVSPYANAGIFSLLTFSWMSPLLKVGSKKTLDIEDVPQLAPPDSVTNFFPLVNSALESEIRRERNVGVAAPTTINEGIGTMKLVKALVFSVRREILWTAFFSFTYTIANYVGPYLIDDFVQYLSGRQAFPNEGYALVSAFFVAKLVECLTIRHWFFRLQQTGMRVRSALVALIYEKGLSLSCRSRQSSTSGEIINIMSVDAQRVGDFSWYMHDLWMVPMQVTLALLILYKNLGLACIATLLATIVVMLGNVPLGKMQQKYQENLMKSKDVRMKATSEILKHMRILKLQAWEMKFLSKITDLRKNESNWLKKFLYTSAITQFVFWGAPTFVAVVTFGTCMLIGIPLESGKILSALATFRILQEPIYSLPDTISMVIQTKVSLDRIASFLRQEDLKADVVERVQKDSSETAVEINDGTFSWDLSSQNPTLKDLNFRVFHGMRVAVCGTVGSGKSSLLSCILGEVPKISGKVKVSGTKAYVSQSPWIQSGKIEENILFGKEMNREKYEEVLDACSLKKDLEILSHGDQTVIGERGINLSGGQKQRMQIARALYQDADIYLFDDPFSAVDAHTGSHLFKECIMRLLSSKTVIYVTHQVEFLPAADLILVMKDGRITQAGKYNDILSSGTDFMELVGAHEQALTTLGDSTEGPADGLEGETQDEKGSTKSLQNGDKKRDGDDKTDEIVGQKGQLVQEEEREKGRVSFSVYWKFITTTYGGALVPIILLAQILFQTLQIGSNYWMAWASPVSKDKQPAVKGSTLILVYVALALGSSLCILVRALTTVTAGYKTATTLFSKMHYAIFRAPMSFFDATPSGRILNRASTDQSAVDLSISSQLGSTAFQMIQLLGIIAVMSQVAWQVFIIFIPVAATCIWYQQYYISTAREISRLIGVCKAPNIQHFAESLAGSSTIRSFDQESRFIDINLNLIDQYGRTQFHNAGAMEWLCFRLDMLSSITFAFSLIFLITLPEGIISPGIAGLAVTYGLNLNMILTWVMWNLCNLENKIISVERIFQYMSIPSEPPLVIENCKPDTYWPSHGEIDVKNLQIRYAPHLPLVLRGLTCTFPGGLKTGIVGRTGSGKSTLIQALFRLVDPTCGEILIDGLNISSIGLHDLRSRLSIIPQDPTMFQGTVRSNLDPLEEYSDDQIWEALDRCQLGDEVRNKEGKLDSTVSENGDNWSMGQRQLVCLGRVILKKSKVLVLDEATASVDTATDNLIQKTLREQFTDSTVITIAHRITSVLDSDMVVLLDNGVIMELDTPAKLLEDKSSLFSKLVAEYTLRSSSSYGNLQNLNGSASG